MAKYSNNSGTNGARKNYHPGAEIRTKRGNKRPAAGRTDHRTSPSKKTKAMLNAQKRKRVREPKFDSDAADNLLLSLGAFEIKNKKIQNISLAPNSTRIQKGLDILEQQEVLPTEQFVISPNDLAERFFFGINCSLSEERKEFSLLSSQTDKEEIENPNILDRQEYTNLRPAYIQTPDKFIDSCDPFYNLDDRSTRAERNTQKILQKDRKPYLVRVASNTSTMNLRSKPIHRLKYFQNIKELEKRGKF